MTTSLTPGQVAALLGTAVTALREECAALPEAVLRFHPAPGQWCVKEVLGHLIESERRGFAGRIRVILASDAPRLEAWDQEVVARARRDCEREARDLVEDLAALRRDSAPLVAALTGPDLERGGHHPHVGFLRVADLLHEWVHHDRNHHRQILANVQAFVWPAMGNTQRFSAPAPPSTG